MSSERRLVCLVLAAALAGAGCADLSRGPEPVASDAGAAADGQAASDGGTALSYAVAVHPLMTSSCMRCHVQGGQAGDTPLLLTGDAAADYTVTLPFVDTTAPASSRLLNLLSGHGHGGGVIYAETTPEYGVFLRWIQGGALP
jgi:hypothetical protein